MVWQPLLHNLLLIFIIFCSVWSHPVNLQKGQIHRCVENATKPESPIVFLNKFRDDRIAYNVFGLTENCIVYTGWMHYLFKPYPEGQGEINGTKGLKGQCKGKQLVMIKTCGNHQKLILAVEAFGRRIRVQNVYEGDFGETAVEDDHVYLNVFRPDRRNQAYSQPLPKGCQIENIFNGNYRLYVLCRSHFDYRVYEVEVYVDAFHYMVVYLRKETLSLHSMLVPPFEGSRGVMLLNMYQDTGDTLELDLTGHSADKRIGLAIINDNNIITDSAEYVDVAMPMGSVFKFAKKGISFLEESVKRLMYYEKHHRFYMEATECVRKLQNMIVYPVNLKSSQQAVHYDDDTLPHAYSRRRFLNDANFHRRMSRPHAFFSSSVSDIRVPYFHLLAVFIGYFIAIILLIGIIVFVNFLRKEYKRRKGFKLSSTEANNAG